MSIHRLRSWISEIWRWVAEGKIVHMCLLVIAAAVALGFFPWRSEVSIRTAGYGLQIAGMIFAIRGLLKIRSHFRQTPLRELFFSWLRRVPKWKNKGVAPIVINENIGNLQSIMSFEIWCQDNPNQPIGKRIEALVRNVERIRIDQHEHANFIDELKKNHEDHKNKVTEQIKNVGEKIHSDMESLQTSDLLPSLVGLVWLTVGITMSTMSKEFFDLLN